MARKPLHLELSGLLTQRERLWQAARKLRRGFTLIDWQDATKPVVPLQTTKCYLDALVRGGWLAQDGEVQVNRGFPQMRYRIARDQLDAPRVTRDGKPVTQGQGVLAMWRAMQILKTFDWHDVQRAASVPGCVVTSHTAKSYVKELAQAGYFHVVQAAKPGTAARYRLARNTGARPPAVCKRGAVLDRNTGEFVRQQSAQEVVDGLE